MQINKQQSHTEPFLTCPQIGRLHTSEPLGWRGIVVEQRYHPAGEYVYPGSSSHMLCLHLGTPISLEQVRNGRTFTSLIARGDLQIVPARTESLWRHQDGSTFMHVHLMANMLQESAEHNDRHNIELLDSFSTRDPRIEHISSALLLEVLEGGISGRIYAESLGAALAARLVQAYTSTSGSLPEITGGLPAPLIRRITAFIEEHLSEDLGLVELAFEVGLSPSHFASLFRKTTGLSPHHYVIQRRLEQAQQLLQSTRLSIGEIASAVGFYDQSHLVRHMRRVMGVTPTYIRKNLSWGGTKTVQISKYSAECPRPASQISHIL